MLKDKYETVKTHVKEHKAAYISSSVVLVAGITCVIMRNQRLTLRTCIRPKSGADVHTTNPQVNVGSHFSGRDVHGDVNMNNYVGSGNHMSKIISCDQDKAWYISQADGARTYTLSESALSKHLNKGEPIPGSDLTFTRRGIVA